MSDDQFRPDPENPEGVRIIGADEAAEVLERDDVARRRGPDEPRLGDRPVEPPADTPAPVMRFPLPSSDSRGPVEEPPGFRVAGADLPHWTEPPTGANPRLFGDDEEEQPEEDWSAFTAGTPRWRDESAGWDEDDDVSIFGDDDVRVGALDESDRDPEDFFRFDEIDETGAHSVFPGQPLEDDEDYEYDDDDEFAAPSPPRKIVVGGGRVSPGGGRSRPATPAVGGDRDLGQAALVGAGFLVVAAVLFYAGPPWALLLVLGVVTLASAEFFTAARQGGYKPATLLGIAATAGTILAVYHRGEQAIPVALVLVVAFSMLWYLFGAGEDQAVLNIGVTLLGFGWVGVFGSYAALLLSVRADDLGDIGLVILFGAILCTVAYDVGGYFVGRSTGRSPLSSASPNKTWEGLAGGCLAALAVGIVFGLGSDTVSGDGWKLGLAVAVAAPLGDLCQSRIKRDLGVKDMGSVLPGHGGLLDRFDALLFVLPAVYYVARSLDFFVG